MRADRTAIGTIRGKTVHGAAQRRALIQAAYELLAEGGFEHLRTRDIAARASVNVATLHYYFATKEDLIRAVVDLVVEQFRTVRAPTYTSQERTPLQSILQELDDAEYGLCTAPEPYIVLFELYARSHRDQKIRAMLKSIMSGWQQYLSGVLEEGVEQGVFRPDLDVATAALGITTFVMGFIVQYMTDPASLTAAQFHKTLEHMLTRI